MQIRTFMKSAIFVPNLAKHYHRDSIILLPLKTEHSPLWKPVFFVKKKKLADKNPDIFANIWSYKKNLEISTRRDLFISGVY